MAYTSFVPGSSGWTATAKVSDTLNPTMGVSTTDSAGLYLFVTDRATPTSAITTSQNNVAVQTILSPIGFNLFQAAGTPTYVFWAYPYLSNVFVQFPRQVQGLSGTFGTLLSQAPFGLPLYLRITCDGAGNYNMFVGDGIIYTPLGSIANLDVGADPGYWLLGDGGRFR